MNTVQKIVRRICSESRFNKIKAGTKQWLIECQKCEHKRDVWDLGGIRYKAAGEPRQFLTCPACGHGGWHKIRRKTETEATEIR